MPDTMKFIMRILRFDPDRDAGPSFQEYEVEAAEDERLLDVILNIKTGIDPSLALRKSCAHGICGSDAMIVNGVERLACKTLIRDVAAQSGAVVTVEPLKGLPVQKDLMVDQDRFFEKYRSVKPFLINDTSPGGKERTQSPAERARFDDVTNCILCASCYSSCPVIREKNPEFIGPAAVVNAARFVFDSRDRGIEDRLPVLDHENGVWPCENHFNCTRVCPRGIKVTKSINETKNAIKKLKGETG